MCEYAACLLVIVQSSSVESAFPWLKGEPNRNIRQLKTTGCSRVEYSIYEHHADCAVTLCHWLWQELITLHLHTVFRRVFVIGKVFLNNQFCLFGFHFIINERFFSFVDFNNQFFKVSL